MLKRLIWVAVATVFFALQLSIGSASALNLDESFRTVKLNESGEQTVLSNQLVQRGKLLFNSTCSQCHATGATKTNPNVELSLHDLAGATPSRDNLMALVDYMEHPTTYDGETDISELHPSTSTADIYPEMRNLTEEDLEAIAGHILIQPNLVGERWGGGKVYN